MLTRSFEPEAERELYSRGYHRRPRVRRAAEARLPLFAEIVSRLGAPRGRLLDVGCGDGRFLARAQQAGWEVEGIEIASEAAELARERTGARIWTTSLEQASPEPAAVITLINVLDQLAEPLLALERSLGWLQAGGRLYARLPNGRLHASIMRLADRLAFARRWLLLSTPLHLHVLNPAQASAAARRAGFASARVSMSPPHAAGDAVRSLILSLAGCPVLTPSMELWARPPEQT